MGDLKKINFLLVLGLCLMHAQLFAQEKGKLEQLVDRVYKIVEGDSAKPRSKYFFVIPIWGISPETGIKLGVSVGYVFRMTDDGETRPSLIRLNTSYTQEEQFNIRPSFDVFFKKNRYNLKGQYVFNDFNEYYWGVGNTAPESAKELYDFNQHRFNVRLMRQVVKDVYVGAQLMYEKIYKSQFSSLSQAPMSEVKGINGYEVLGAGLAFAYDNRDNIYFPLRGAYLEISNHFFQQHSLSDYKFNAVTIDLRKYFPLWKENVFAINGIGAFNGGQVPYRQMGTIGTENFMRGYYNGRFRDHHMFSVQGELRKTIWGPLGMAVFGGVGNVGNSFNNLGKNLKPNYGIGFRAMVIRKEHINARLDIGFGEKNIRGFYFTLSEAF
jgi:outer membrane protein assembly factor BamA